MNITSDFSAYLLPQSTMIIPESSNPFSGQFSVCTTHPCLLSHSGTITALTVEVMFSMYRDNNRHILWLVILKSISTELSFDCNYFVVNHVEKNHWDIIKVLLMSNEHIRRFIKLINFLGIYQRSKTGLKITCVTWNVL